MKKKIISVIAVFVCAIIIVGISRHSDSDDTIKKITSTDEEKKNVSAASWKEVPIEEGKYVAQGSMQEYDLKEIVNEADYVFSGNIVDRKEYEVEWTDENGELRGPFSKSVIEVKINNEYYGESPVSGDSIRVYYPYSLSMDFEGSFPMEEGKEYIFVAKAFDEEFIERRKTETPDSKYEQEKYADVYISDACYDLLPIENGNVYMYHDYFYWNDEVMEQVIPEEAVAAEDVAEPELIESGWFIALDKQNFENAFLQLFEKPEVLPDAEQLMEIHKKKSEESAYVDKFRQETGAMEKFGGQVEMYAGQ